MLLRVSSVNWRQHGKGDTSLASQEIPDIALIGLWLLPRQHTVDVASTSRAAGNRASKDMGYWFAE